MESLLPQILSERSENSLAYAWQETAEAPHVLTEVLPIFGRVNCSCQEAFTVEVHGLTHLHYVQLSVMAPFWAPESCRLSFASKIF